MDEAGHLVEEAVAPSSEKEGKRLRDMTKEERQEYLAAQKLANKDKLEKLKEEKTSRELDPEAQRKANLEEKRKALAIKREQMRNK